MTREELLKKITVWRSEYGTHIPGKQYPQIPFDKRIILFRPLVKELIGCGIEEDYFNGSIVNFIAENITPQGIRNRSKSLDICRSEFIQAVALEYQELKRGNQSINKPVEKKVLLQEEIVSLEEPTELDIEYDEEMSDFLGYKKDE
jgi:hypothetical protein